MYIPDDMIEASGHVFAGEYDIMYDIDNPIILDIGANIGAFAVWAKYRWPTSSVICYEPINETFQFLQKNTENRHSIKCINAAVGSRAENARLMYYGKSNRGQCGFYLTPEQIEHGEQVQVISASTLPQAHIIKIDTEGSEVEILSDMNQQPHVYLLEYHSPIKRKAINSILSDYVLVESKMGNITRGILKYIREDILMSQLDDDTRKLIELY